MILFRVFIIFIFNYPFEGSAGLSDEIYSQLRLDSLAEKLPGHMVEVDKGRNLYLHCGGKEKQGQPTVILEAGAGEPGVFWALVQPELEKITRVCSYDRAGLGSSSENNQTHLDRVEDLHRLLSHSKIVPPYILVGHSIGGWIANRFARKYPKTVNGVVLAESALFSFPPESAIYEQLKKTGKSYQQFKEDSYKELSEEAENQVKKIRLNKPEELKERLDRLNKKYKSSNHSMERTVDYLRLLHDSLLSEKSKRALIQEYLLIPNAVLRNGESLYQNMSDIPLIVVMGDHVFEFSTPPYPPGQSKEAYLDESMARIRKFSDELLRLSTQSSFMLAENSGHNVQLDRPDVIIKAVKKILLLHSESSGSTLKSP